MVDEEWLLIQLQRQDGTMGSLISPASARRNREKTLKTEEGEESIKHLGDGTKRWVQGELQTCAVRVAGPSSNDTW